MKVVRAWGGRNRLKGLVAAFCAAAIALGSSMPAAAQNYGGRSSAEEDAATAGTSDPGAPSTLEMPTETRQVVDATEQPPAAPSVTETPCAKCDEDPNAPVREAAIPPDTATYEAQDSEFDADELATSWIGLSLTRDRRKLKSGEYTDGLLILGVQADSPAAKAGLQPPIEGKARTAAEVATLVAGIVFPPAMVGVALIRSSQSGESYDMIIGVDGDRITNIVDFENHLRIVQPGQVVYLSIVRDGFRRQVPVSIPRD
jgi:hypothetical protein